MGCSTGAATGTLLQMLMANTNRTFNSVSLNIFGLPGASAASPSVTFSSCAISNSSVLGPLAANDDADSPRAKMPLQLCCSRVFKQLGFPLHHQAGRGIPCGKLTPFNCSKSPLSQQGRLLSNSTIYIPTDDGILCFDIR
eukprot:2789748-Amphidinium_carterae.2